jgi:ribosomal protein S18 acetylase RimI-like enzyme
VTAPSDADVGTPSVRLVPLTGEEFDRWSELSVAGFAADQVAAGVLAEPEATAYARGALADQLPDGLATPLQHLFAVRDDEDRGIGSLWLRVRPLSTEVEAFVLDIELSPEFRGRGLGRATMLAAQRSARDLGASVMRLNVFGHNARARRLYASLGFQVVRTAVARDLVPPSSPGSATGSGDGPALRLRPADAAEVASLRRLVETELAELQHTADVLPEVEAHAQAYAVAEEWAAALRSGAALVAEQDGRVVALVRLDDGAAGYRAQLLVVGGSGDEATPDEVMDVLDRLAEAAAVHGAVGVEATVHGAEPSVGDGGYLVTAQTMVKRW